MEKVDQRILKLFEYTWKMVERKLTIKSRGNWDQWRRKTEKGTGHFYYEDALKGSMDRIKKMIKSDKSLNL